MANVSAKTFLPLSVACAAALFVGACSHSDGDAASETTSAHASATSAAPPTSAAPSAAPGASTSEAAPEHAAQPVPPADAPGMPAGDPAGSNKVEDDRAVMGNNGPADTGQVAIEGPQASPEDAEGIRNLVMGFNEQQTIHTKLAYLPEHTCKRVLDQNGGPGAFNLDAIPDGPVDANGGTSTNVVEVGDVRVNGDQASATVTVAGKDGPQSAVQRFSRENGAWTFCD